MKYQESAFFRFGLHAGAASFLRNGFTPGFREAASAVLQPINSYTRFPEYHFMEQAVAAAVQSRDQGTYLPLKNTSPGIIQSSETGISEASESGLETGRRQEKGPLRILDLGSPKLFGFYLARHYEVDLLMTDISPLNIDPGLKMWAPLRARARGRARFEIRDARRLSDPGVTYDIVYAMSVLEHVEGEGGDAAAVGEMLRVLKPGGLLMFSVPFGPLFREQAIRGVAHSVQRTRRDNLFFFQRIYDRTRVENRLLRPLRGRIDRENVWTIDRRPSRLLRSYHVLRGCLPESLMTALGFLNPIMSAALNRHRPGVGEPEVTAYGTIHHFGDIYGDLIYIAHKKVETSTASNPRRPS